MRHTVLSYAASHPKPKMHLCTPLKREYLGLTMEGIPTEKLRTCKKKTTVLCLMCLYFLCCFVFCKKK